MQFMRLLLLCVYVCACVCVCSVSGAPTLTVTPNPIPSGTTTITVSWTGVDHPSKLDYIGMYAPMDNPDDHYFGVYMATNGSTWASGSAHFDAPGALVNLRTPVEFRFFSAPASAGSAAASQADLSVVARSDPVKYANVNGPDQVHLAMTLQPTELAVSWVSASGATASAVYGAHPSELSLSAVAVAVTYTIDDMCSGPANESTYFIDPGYTHTAVMKGLSPGGKVYYKVGSESMGWSEIFEAKVPVAPGPDASVRIAIYGDMGVALPFTIIPTQQPPAKKTVKWLMKEDVDSIMHVGDISYARGNAFLWDYFMMSIQGLGTTRPIQYAVGNHDFLDVEYAPDAWRPPFSNDYGNDSGGECGVPYFKRFAMPGAAATNNMYYAYNHGNVHFVVLSTETDFLPGSVQWKFVEADLKAVNRSVTPWVVAAMHRPLYTSSAGMLGSVFIKHLRESFAPLFVKYGVDVVTAGHVHKYERTLPIRSAPDGEPSPGPTGYPVYVLLGMAGHNYQAPWSEINPGHFYQPEWSVFRTSEWGYTILSTTATSLTMEYRGDQDNAVHDEFTLNLADQIAHRRWIAQHPPEIVRNLDNLAPSS